jgi:hypothetical protein
MIAYMKELHYAGVFNNQSSAKSDFSLSISDMFQDYVDWLRSFSPKIYTTYINGY